MKGVVERIMARVTIDENGCHVFGGCTNHGYGQVSLPGGRCGYTHRVMYEAANGPIPDGLHIDHLCRNRSCCNPEHLEAVTPRENLRRSTEANRKPTHGAYRTDASARNPWTASIRDNGRNVYLGLFPTQEAALVARREAEQRLGWYDASGPERRQQIIARKTDLEQEPS